MAVALMREVVVLARGEKLELASYQLLERLAQHADDEETAEVMRRNRSEGEAMAQKLESSWDKAADLSFAEEAGVTG